MDKPVIFIILGIILLGIGFWAWQADIFNSKPVVIPDGIILFYGDGCPHCENVEKYISDNKVEEKVSFTRLEVWKDTANQKILLKVAEKCGISADTVGIPFLFDGTNCMTGDEDAIKFFKEKAGI